MIKLDRKRNNVVVSRRAVVEASMGEERAKLLATLKEGAIVKGIVKNITDYGAFVDLGGIDGLLHITDLAWRRVRHPSEVVDQSVRKSNAKVLKFDQEKSRVSLGLKQLGEDPWIGIARRYPQNTRLFGKVTNITDYGAFVEIETGIEGLVHVSEMDWTNKNVDPKKSRSARRRSRSHGSRHRRRPSPHQPRHEAVQGQPLGRISTRASRRATQVKGQVKSITDFGVFIGLARRHRRSGSPLRPLLEQNRVKTPCASTRRATKSKPWFSASIPNVNASAWASSSSRATRSPTSAGSHERNTIVKGTVKSVDAKGAVIDLGNDTEGYLRASEISSERVEDATTQLTVGQEVEALITSVDRKNRSIQLSIKAKDAAEARKALDRVNSDASAGTTNLGALLKAKLEQK